MSNSTNISVVYFENATIQLDQKKVTMCPLLRYKLFNLF